MKGMNDVDSDGVCPERIVQSEAEDDAYK